jgi:hypothetical protein
MKLELISNYFNPNIVLDIGANTGQFHTLFLSYYPSSWVFSIEASKECEPYLKKITNNYYIGLLAKDNKDYNFHYIPNDPLCTGMSIYKEVTPYWQQSTTIKKKGIKLDDLFKENFIFDLIKIDVQGAEIDVMKGGSELCKKAKGILLEVSLTQYNTNAPLYNNVIEYMESINYNLVEVLSEVKNEKTHQQDILFINKNKQ